MTWTPEHSILIAKEICGYEVQTSPKGVHYVIEDGRTRPLPDFPNDPGETLTTLEAWLKVRPDSEVMIEFIQPAREFRCELRTLVTRYGSWGNTATQAICGALYRAVAK